MGGLLETGSFPEPEGKGTAPGVWPHPVPPLVGTQSPPRPRGTFLWDPSLRCPRALDEALGHTQRQPSPSLGDRGELRGGEEPGGHVWGVGRPGGPSAGQTQPSPSVLACSPAGGCGQESA